ncbi:hypothetical protein MMC28_001764 [Mycoblastus sanguinarius]|nr:hypothetical protein [Mycoblastus sanguinarius]
MLNLNLPLRIIQLILAIISLGLNSYITSWYIHHTKTHTSPSQAPFLIFTSAFTLLTLPYLFLNPALSHTHEKKPNGPYFNKWAVLALDTLTMLFWFAGFIALADFHGGLIICAGHVCTFMFAGVVVGALAWASFLVSTVLATLHTVRTRGGSESKTHAGWVGNVPTTSSTVQV